jgi:hypothetical protein
LLFGTRKFTLPSSGYARARRLNRRLAGDVPTVSAAGGDVSPRGTIIMKNGLLIAVGVLVTLAGVVFALQGFNVMGGSAMSGSSVWKILGPLIAVAGLVILSVALRRGRLASR